MRPTGRGSGAGLVVAGLLLAGCVTPATGADSYHDKASTTVRAAASEVATAQLTVRLVRRDRIQKAYADETVTSSETALGSIGNAFGSVQPPAGDDKLRDDVTTLVSDAEDAVAHARIAVRRGDPADLADAAHELTKSSADLSQAQKALS
jgi:outer membrane murein-binding lipoprotein Lpp